MKTPLPKTNRSARRLPKAEAGSAYEGPPIGLCVWSYPFRGLRQPVGGRLVSVLCLLLAALVLFRPTAELRSEEANLSRLLDGKVPRDVDELKALQERIQALADQIVSCTVAIRVGGVQGSGVVVSEDGDVLTAGHVVGQPNLDVTFIFPDGTEAKGKTLGANRQLDSGMMKITDPGVWRYAELGDSSELDGGDWVLGTGHPNGYQPDRPQPVLRLGRVLVNREIGIITDCPVVSGDSGGPLFDLNGKIVGIHSRIGGPLAANVHVPASTYQDTWQRLASGEHWGYLPGSGPFLGVQGDLQAKQARIVHVLPGTAADKAGLQPGDVVTELDGEEIADFPSLIQLVRTKQSGDKVKLKIERDGEQLVLDVVIGRR